MDSKIALEAWAGREEQYHTAVSIICHLKVGQSYDDDLDRRAILKVAQALRIFAYSAAIGEDEYYDAIEQAELHEAALIG